VTILIAILGLSFLIVVHEAGHMLAARAMGVHVKEYAVGFGQPILRKKIGKTHYSLRWILFGGFVRMKGMDDGEAGPDSYSSKPPWRRAFIIFAGPLANLVAAVLIAFAFFALAPAPVPRAEVAEVSPNSMAEEVGIRPGDELIAVDGERIEGWEGFVSAVSQRSPGEEVTVVVERGGRELEFSGTLTASPEDPDRPLVGVSPVTVQERLPVSEAFARAVQFNVAILLALGDFIGQIITGEQSFRENVAGPVGIVTITGESVQQGFFFLLLAFISLQLAIFNLLPFLPLDGGHLLFIAAEKVRGRPVSRETMGKIGFIGFAVLILFVIFVTVGDVGRLISGEPLIPEQPPE
jgi:regulator of sigma E protease